MPECFREMLFKTLSNATCRLAKLLVGDGKKKNLLKLKVGRKNKPEKEKEKGQRRHAGIWLLASSVLGD